MFSGADIRRVFMIVPTEAENTVLAALGEEEIIHFDDENSRGGDMDYRVMGNELKLVDEIYGLLEQVTGVIGVSGSVPTRRAGENSTMISVEKMREDRNRLKEMQEKINQYERLTDLIHREQVRISGILKTLFRQQGLLRLLPVPEDSSLFCIVEGEGARIHSLEWDPPVPAMLVGTSRGNVVLTMCGYMDNITKYLKNAGADRITRIRSGDRVRVEEELERLYARYRELAWRRVKLTYYINARKKQWGDDIQYLLNRYRLKRLVASTSSGFGHTGSTTIMGGWMNYSEATAATQVLQRICGSRYVFIISSRKETLEEGQKVPVRLRNNRFFAPFELLLKNVGMPSLQEIDPTPLAAMAYVIMFGVMFGDVGQGMVLVFAGLVLHMTGRMKTSLFLKNGGIILAYCGVSATMFGFMYGSVFSNEHLIPPLWFSPMENIMRLLGFTVMMGACFIGTGLVIGVLNRLRRGDTREALLGTRGMMGLLFYGGLCTAAAWYVKNETFPPVQMLVLLLALPLLLFVLRGIIWKLVRPAENAFPHGIFEYVVESIVEIIEMVSGYLGNTISFIRTGAFALSHAGLGMAIYALADLVGEGGISPASITVIVTGNIFIILLEGLLCSIQALRLEYYEFFSRFYDGSGTPFVPFSLKQPAA